LTAGPELFLDSNVLLYAAGGKAGAPEKHARALDVLMMDFCLSTQVLAEFYVNATRKGPQPLTRDDALEWVTQLARKPCQAVDAAIVKAGIELSQRFRTSYWDGAVLASAKRMGARTVFSEDMNHGQDYDGVVVINPFL
jgi:predicted nucleic acid-binding protein